MKHLEDMQAKLEDLVDQADLQTVLECLARVCFEKEEHILINWQDKPLSKVWSKAGQDIMRVFGKVTV